MTDEKVETLKKIKPVKSLKYVQHFLGFANVYRRFIKDYSKIILPMTNSMSLEKHDWHFHPGDRIGTETTRPSLHNCTCP